MCRGKIAHGDSGEGSRGLGTNRREPIGPPCLLRPRSISIVLCGWQPAGGSLSSYRGALYSDLGVLMKPAGYDQLAL